MAIATLHVHGSHPIWAAEGDAELPITNMAATTAVSLTGLGAFSLDHALGIHVSKPVAALALLGVAAGVVVMGRRPRFVPWAEKLEDD